MATTIITTTDTPTRMGEADALPLLAWLSPGYPVGAYAYSHGLEWAVEAGDIRDEASLAAWLADLVEYGAGRNDAILLAAAYAAAAEFDPAHPHSTPSPHPEVLRRSLDEDLVGSCGVAHSFVAINDLALALAPSRELHLETSQQGRSFLDATLAAWPVPVLADLATHLHGPVAYPVAVGLAAAVHGIPLGAVLPAYVLAFVQNLVSAGLRLAPVGQTAGTRVIAGLMPLVRRVAREAETLGLDDIGGATFRADLGSLRHETQYSRLFRS